LVRIALPGGKEGLCWGCHCTAHCRQVATGSAGVLHVRRENMLYARVRQATAGEHALCHVLVSVFTASVWGWATLWEGLFCALVRTESVLMSLTCLRKKSHIVSSWQISTYACKRNCHSDPLNTMHTCHLHALQLWCPSTLEQASASTRPMFCARPAHCSRTCHLHALDTVSVHVLPLSSMHAAPSFCPVYCTPSEHT
jgi:hypothetical protein